MLGDMSSLRKHPWLAISGIAAVGIFGLVLLMLLTP